MSANARQVAICAVHGPEMWRLIAEEGVTPICGAPAVLTTLVDGDNKRRVTNLHIMTVGAPSSPTIIMRCENIGVEIAHVYSLTEFYGPFTVCESQPNWKDMTVRRRAVLKARQGVATVANRDVRTVEQSDILDAPLIDVPNDGVTTGEIAMTDNGVMNSYPEDPEATEHAFRGGWFHTGDLGVMYPDDYTQLLDRVKDAIVSGNEDIPIIEVEQAVVSYPDVSDCATISVSNGKWGGRPHAYVVLRPETRCRDTAEEVIEHNKNVAKAVVAHYRAHITGYKILRGVVVVDELLRISTDEVRGDELRNLAWAGEKTRIKGWWLTSEPSHGHILQLKPLLLEKR